MRVCVSCVCVCVCRRSGSGSWRSRGRIWAMEAWRERSRVGASRPFLPSTLFPGRVAIFGGASSVLIDLYLTRLFSSFAPAAGDPPASVHIRRWTSHFPSVSLGLLRSSFFFYPRSLLVSWSVRRKKVGFCSRRCCPVPFPSCYGPRLDPRPRPFALVSPPILVVSCRRCIVAISRDVHPVSVLASLLSLPSWCRAAPCRRPGVGEQADTRVGKRTARHGRVYIGIYVYT